jgi:hypothetical protein
MTVVMVVTVIVVVVAVSSTDEVQGLLQNPISDFHAVNRLIEQVCQLMMPFLPCKLRPLPKIFSVMIIVFNPVGQQYPQLVDGGFCFHDILLFLMYWLPPSDLKSGA